jgi:hypothetical protein
MDIPRYPWFLYKYLAYVFSKFQTLPAYGHKA